jgi:hypothetical protein
MSNEYMKEKKMLTKQMTQEIIDLNARGYSVNEIAGHFAGKAGKVPSLPTIRKYYAMDVAPGNPGENLTKDKVFDVDPWKSAIIAILRNNPKKCYGSSVYDVLCARFIENGEYERLPASERTLRNYIGFLIESGQVEAAPNEPRTYDYVFDTPPGQQMLLDFGEMRLGKGLAIHFICMLLRYSRMICVYARVGQATKNLGLLRKFVLNLMEADKNAKGMSMKAKQIYYRNDREAVVKLLLETVPSMY